MYFRGIKFISACSELGEKKIEGVPVQGMGSVFVGCGDEVVVQVKESNGGTVRVDLGNDCGVLDLGMIMRKGGNRRAWNV